MDAVTLEYTYLLTNQLESQRLYFEEKMGAIEEKMRGQVSFHFFNIIFTTLFLFLAREVGKGELPDRQGMRNATSGRQTVAKRKATTRQEIDSSRNQSDESGHRIENGIGHKRHFARRSTKMGGSSSRIGTKVEGNNGNEG